MKLIKRIKDYIQDKAPLSEARSSKWPAIRKRHLELEPWCAICGSSKKLEVHHIVPFHVDRSRELDPKNLITLCESNPKFCCHRIFGHLNNYRSYNPDVRKDAAEWAEKLRKAKKT